LGFKHLNIIFRVRIKWEKSELRVRKKDFKRKKDKGWVETNQGSIQSLNKQQVKSFKPMYLSWSEV
jgi:hypothetical protein